MCVDQELSLCNIEHLAMNSSISESVIQCLKIFSVIVPRIRQQATTNRGSIRHALWEDEQGRLRLWAANIGAHQTGQSALDYRLRDASHIKQQVVNILTKLKKDLGEAEEVSSEYVSSKESDRLDDSFEDEGPEAELHQLHQMIVSSITCLFQMSMLVRKPARHDFLRLPESREVSAFKPWDQAHVRDKYPKAQADIVERLGIAMTTRRHYLRYRQRHRAKLSKGLGIAQAVCGSASEDASIVMSETIASDMNDLLLEVDDAQSKTGISQTSYASSMINKGSIRVPIPPKESADGAPFECPYCFLLISVTGSLSWHQHVFHDLQPYVCTVSGCSTPQALYSTRKEWFRHLRRSHPKSWRSGIGESHITEILDDDPPSNSGFCALCDHECRSERHLVRHLAGHLQEVALFILPRTDGDSDAGNISDEQDNLAPEALEISPRAAADRTADVDRLDFLTSLELELRNLLLERHERMEARSVIQLLSTAEADSPLSKILAHRKTSVFWKANHLGHEECQRRWEQEVARITPFLIGKILGHEKLLDRRSDHLATDSSDTSHEDLDSADIDSEDEDSKIRGSEERNSKPLEDEHKRLHPQGTGTKEREVLPDQVRDDLRSREHETLEKQRENMEMVEEQRLQASGIALLSLLGD